LPESLLSRRLKLGTFLGVGLYVHWTFALVIGFVAINARSGGPLGIAFAVAQLLGVFVCVTLHEYGHAMAARGFGIGTADITLLPIGGVARLRRMPRIPWQELVVAVAGPAVNVVIVIAILLGCLAFADAYVLNALIGYFVAALSGAPMNEQMVATMIDVFTSPSLLGYAVLMLIVNIMLVLFNMIPAFPMDGGRVFRSLMAMVMDYRRATTIASRVGLVLAALMAFFALSAAEPNPIPVLIAAFIGYAGIAEARQVEVMESVRGLTVGQVMVRTDSALPMDMPLAEILRYWQSNSMPAMPVVSIAGTVVGMLTLGEVAQRRAAGADPATTAGQLVDHESSVGFLRADQELESALLRTGQHRRQIPVVNEYGHLLGILDLDSMLARGQLSRRSAATQRGPYDRFDQMS
jgi:Zn-dependent protease